MYIHHEPAVVFLAALGVAVARHECGLAAVAARRVAHLADERVLALGRLEIKLRNLKGAWMWTFGNKRIKGC
eukprot:349620-Chlamydomonas_euryale.AAC.1